MTIQSRFNNVWNGGYDFSNPANLQEITAVESYDIAADAAQYAPSDVIDSPWGSNRVVSTENHDGIETCIKEIIVKPGFMLSLQRHRGRAEIWEVTDGTLGVICNGEYSEIPSGQSITLPEGAVHCMINPTGKPVTVKETQRGICREKDNIRLVDFNDRATYPLTSETEYKSALLYRDIMKKLKGRA